jgi:hypothetical protein
VAATRRSRLGAVVRVVATLVTGAALAATLAGCGSTVPGRAEASRVPARDLSLIHGYLVAFNAAGDRGPAAQAAFLRSTQEPGTPPPRPDCFAQVTLRTQIVDRTVRADPDFLAPRRGAPAARPTGAVYVMAASVSAVRDGTPQREAIGSKHLVVRDGHVFDYAPCPD